MTRECALHCCAALVKFHRMVQFSAGETRFVQLKLFCWTLLFVSPYVMSFDFALGTKTLGTFDEFTSYNCALRYEFVFRDDAHIAKDQHLLCPLKIILNVYFFPIYLFIFTNKVNRIV